MNSIKQFIKWSLYSSPIVLLFVSDSLFFPFISGKGMLFRLLVEVALVFYIYLALRDKTFRPQKTLILVAVCLFTFLIFISAIVSEIPSKAIWSNFERMEGFVLIGHLCAYVFMLASVLKTSKEWRIFFLSVFSTSVAMSLFASLQLLGGTVINQGGVRIDSLMGNSAYFAGFSMFTAFLSLFILKQDPKDSKGVTRGLFFGALLFLFVYVLSEQKTQIGSLVSIISFLSSLVLLWFSYNIKKEKIHIAVTSSIIFCFFVAQTFLVFLTQTRGASLGLLGGLFVTTCIISLFEKRERVRFLARITLGLIVCVIIGFVAIKNTAFVKQSPVLHRFAEISWKNTTGQARQIIWPMAIEGFKERPVFGWGQEGFNYVFAKYYNPELWRHEPWFDRTHNVFLDWLVAGGLVGFLAYVSLYVFLIRSLFVSFWKEKKTEFAILVGLISAYVFQNLFIFDNLASYILFFALLAFAHGISLQQNAVKESKMQTRTEMKISPVLLFSFLSVFLFTTVYIFVVRPYMQNRLIIKGMSPQKNITDNLNYFKKAFALGGGGVAEAREQFMSVTNQILPIEQISLDIKRGFFVELLNQTKLQQEQRAMDAKTILSLASGFNQNGNPEIALQLLAPLRAISPQKQHILMQIAVAHLLKNEVSQAEGILKENFENTPEYPDGAMLYASVLLDRGQSREALEILNVFVQKGEMLKPYIINNLWQKGFKKELTSFLEKIEEINPSSNAKGVLMELQKQNN